MSQKEHPHIQKALFCSKLMVRLIRILDLWWHTFPCRRQRLYDQTNMVFYTREAKPNSLESSTWATARLKVAASPGSKPGCPGTLKESEIGVRQSSSEESLQHECHGIQPELRIFACPQALGYFHSLAKGGNARREKHRRWARIECKRPI